MKQHKRFFGFLLFVALTLLTCITMVGCDGQKSDVQLTGISGGALSELPEGVNELKFKPKDEFMLLSSSNGQSMINDEDFQKHEDIDTVAQSTLSSVEQTVVLFAENQYASITINLDNPYDYYICDFYMTCSQADAMIYVDDEWLPLDGSVKIRWTGSTNRKATYTVYLPTVDAGATISVKDMRYLNEKEIAIDLNAHDVANVYRMEAPVKTEFVVNTPEFFLFKVIQSENCSAVTVEGATYDENEGAYKMTADGVYKVKYTYTIPGTDLIGEGEIVSDEIELLTCSTVHSHVDGPILATIANFYGIDTQLQNLIFSGTGVTFRDADTSQPEEAFYPDFSYCNVMFEVSLNGLDFVPAKYVKSATFGNSFNYDLWLDTDINWDDNGTTQPIEIRWNGYTIYSGHTYDGV